MNLFKSFTLLWWQAGLLKVALLALGITIGATWPHVFLGWRTALLVVFVAAAGYVTYLWAIQ